MALALAAAPAHADSSRIEFEPASSRAVTLRALAVFRMALPPGDLIVHRAWCPDGSPGCASPATGDVWARDRFALAQEIGHLFDARVLTHAERLWFAQRFRLADRLWDPRRWDSGRRARRHRQLGVRSAKGTEPTP